MLFVIFIAQVPAECGDDETISHALGSAAVVKPD
jgi:hypothetical protein